MPFRSLAEKAAQLEDEWPQDFDPEQASSQGSSSSDEDSDSDLAREHYQPVGWVFSGLDDRADRPSKSKLRAQHAADLGEQYTGQLVSRKDLASEESESELSQDSSQESLEGEDLSDIEQDAGDQNAEREELKALMAADQKQVVSSLKRSIAADAEKGRAVKAQRSTYESLLSTRIKLQKALIASNSFEGVGGEAVEAAEKAALQLLDNMTALRVSLGAKRPISAVDSGFRASIDDLDAASKRRHRATLTKWAHKSDAGSRGKLAAAANSDKPFTAVLDGHLSGSNMEKLVSRAHTPRNCAPSQQAAGVEEDASIYDDTDWYSLLLRELVDAKMADVSGRGGCEGLLGSLAELRQTKQHRRGVDVKASKGRKLRYTVHEKLQNFMAPQENVGSWTDRQADELFAGLFGQKVNGVLNEEESDDEMEVDGLKLFGAA